MHYYAKLALGRIYKVHGILFERDEEHEVTKEVYDYLKTVVEKQLTAEGNRYVTVDIPRFALRTEDETVQEKVLNEIENAPDTLKPKKPGPKPNPAS